MYKLVLLILLPFAVSAVATATRRASFRLRCLGATTVTATLGVALFMSNRAMPSSEDLVLFGLILGFPVAAAFLTIRLNREHSPCFGALLTGPIAFVATLVFVVGMCVDLGWLRK
jgi:hypothetical protein